MQAKFGQTLVNGLREEHFPEALDSDDGQNNFVE